jgi:hypothetical protein
LNRNSRHKAVAAEPQSKFGVSQFGNHAEVSHHDRQPDPPL